MAFILKPTTYKLYRKPYRQRLQKRRDRTKETAWIHQRQAGFGKPCQDKKAE